MSIASEIQRIQGNIADAYTACGNKEATMPATQNSENLPDCIDSIQRGFACTVYVYAPSSTVVTLDGKTKTVSDSYVTFDIYAADDYTVTGVCNGYTQTDTVTVSSATSTSITLVFNTTITVQTQPDIVLTCDGTSITATGTSVQFTVWETDDYTITGALNGYSGSTTVTVSDLHNTYSTSLYLYSNLTVESDEGAVITVNGESKTVTGTSVSFVVYQAGSTTITAVRNGVTRTKTVTITLGTDVSTTISFTSVVEVDYIQGDGGYINTGFLPQMGDTYTFEVARLTAVTSNSKVPVWGSNFTAMNNEDTTHKGVGFGTMHGDRQIGIRRGITRYWNSTGNTGNWAQQGFVKFILTIGATTNLNPTITKDGSTITISQEGYVSQQYAMDSTVPIGIFCSIYNGSAVCISNGDYRLRSFKVTRNGTTVADFRAAVDPNDVAGLYDRVSDTFVASVGNVSYQE